MLKKILLGAVILVAAGIALFGFGSYKVIDDAIKDKEPQIRQYMQLDEAAQNKFILDNAGELLDGIDIDEDGTPEDKEQLNLLKRTYNHPEVQQALTELGRSFMAVMILASDAIVTELTADAKAKYQHEKDQFKARLEKYGELLEKAKNDIK